MKGKDFESFVFNGEKAPDWFNKEANAGRVKLVFDEDEIVGCQISSGTKVYEATIGDSIINTKYGLMVLPKEKAKTYGVQKKDEKQKENKEEKESVE